MVQQEESFGLMGMWRLEQHNAYVKTVTPREKFVMMELKEGWGPLGEALGKEVPDEEFPRANDAEAVERLEGRILVEAAKVWGVISAGVSVAVYAVLAWRSR